jgi:internalin A
MYKILALISGAICLFSASIASAAPSAQKPQSFAQWCIQKKSLAAETRYTLNVLLKQAGTNDCQRADAKLRNLTTLSLTDNKIVDIKPLAGLRNLRYLLLERHQIVDVKPESACKF